MTKLEPIVVSNCPVCNAFPVQHIAAAEVTAYRFLSPRNTLPASAALLAAEDVAAEPNRLEWSGTLCDGERVNYATAEQACAALGEGWRLPTRQELESILDLSRHDPAIDPERFPDTKSDWYWTSTPCAWSSGYAWVVHFGYGDVSSLHRDGDDAFVRAVRSVPAGQ